MVYYRKYRPQTIEELDLDSVRTRLSAILSAKELPHAFLFTGPKGLGKTSSARILAKSISCPKRSGIEPCNKCDVCISITNGSNIDVLEIDAASNRGIDEIRDLREKIKFAPVSLSRKVYIIDEVHMLTTDAFNALLKTLEEPPSHAVFILCTTEIEKIPGTIASRSFHVSFQKPSVDELIRSLQRIVKGEKLDIEKGVLEEIYKLSEGAFRDAAKILEELAISTNGKITKEVLEDIYKMAGSDKAVGDLLDKLSKKDVKGSMEIVEGLVESGADFKVVTEKLAIEIHRILMHRAGIKTVGVKDVPDFQTGQLNKLLHMVNESYRDLKFSVLPQIPLELVVVGWCLSGGVQSDKQDVGSSIVDGGQIVDKKKLEQPKKLQEPEPPLESNQTSKIKDPVSKTDHGVLFDASSKPDNFIAAFISRLKIDNHSVAGILRGCRLVEITPGSVVFETKYRFHKDKLSEAKTNIILDTQATELLREDVHVVVNLVEK